MKHPLHTLSLLLAALLTLTLPCACDKMPDNGDLDGMWQLMSITTADGNTRNVKDAQLYWSFRLRLVQYSGNRTTSAGLYYSHFQHEGNTLRLTDFCKYANYETGTDDNEWVQPEEADQLHPWGIHPTADPANSGKVTATFHVDQLSPTSLILTSDDTRLTFRKF